MQEIMMKYNYHTHTSRCHHAYGEDREYVENAIKAGVKKLGISDHVPYPFPNGYISGVRMLPSEVENYVTSVRSMQKEYQKDIEIFLGFECEFFKAYWSDLCRLLDPYDVDYMILGQHFLGSEDKGNPTSRATTDEAVLKQYVDEVIEGMHTGCFTYLAHPDLIHFTGDDTIYKKYMTQICLTANELQMPLEINFCGYLSRRHYPCDKFFTLAKSLDCKFVYGRDAHTPDAFFDRETFEGCDALAKRCDITPLDEVILKKPEFSKFY